MTEKATGSLRFHGLLRGQWSQRHPRTDFTFWVQILGRSTPQYALCAPQWCGTFLRCWSPRPYSSESRPCCPSVSIATMVNSDLVSARRSKEIARAISRTKNHTSYSQKLCVSMPSPRQNRATHSGSWTDRRLRLDQASTAFEEATVSADEHGRERGGLADRRTEVWGAGGGCDQEQYVRVCFETIRCVVFGLPSMSAEYIHAAARKSWLSSHESKLLVPMRVLRVWLRKGASFLAYPRRSSGPYFRMHRM